MKYLKNQSGRRVASRLAGIMLILGMLIFSSDANSTDTEDFIQQWQIDEKWTGDFDAMVERRRIRVLVVPNKMMFFFDRAQIRGVAYETFREFEKFINAKLKIGTRKIKVIFLPVTRDQLLPWLIEGRGDIASANLTITENRQKVVAFTRPSLTKVKEIIITGPAAPPVKSIESLAGAEIHVRSSSSYYEHLNRLNDTFRERGREPITIFAANEYLEDSDLLEMVNAGLIPMIVVDDHKANFWVQIFDKITLHPEIAVNTGGKIAWAIRQNSPKLEQIANEFIQKHKKGTLLGNIVFKRYLETNKWARSAMSPEELQKKEKVEALFKKYADKYDFDYLMIVAQAYQESQLDHSRRSPTGAVGIMQLLPSTAADKNVNIPEIDNLENNIHAGVKYLRFLQDRYFSDAEMDPLNQMLFAFAAYNAGPAKVRGLRRDARKMGLDPNIWFGNVEIAAAKRIGRETVQYVSNIYKYYLAYGLARSKLQTAEEIKLTDIDK